MIIFQSFNLRSCICDFIKIYMLINAVSNKHALKDAAKYLAFITLALS